MRTFSLHRYVWSKIAFFLFASVIFSQTASGVTQPRVEIAPVPDRGIVALRAAITRAATDLTLISFAAHPDDEDGATLAYYSKHIGARTAAVISTRGEGGQNEIGPELYSRLAVIRSGEQEQAAAIYGSELFFLNFPEFGYSKSAHETLEIWGYEYALGEVVRIIRELTPDIIITNHDTVSGHGHHQALGRLVLDAFDAAADPNAYTDQLTSENLATWQTKKVYVRCSSFNNCTPDDGHVTVPVGSFDAVRGFTYSQIAQEALKQHRSQGMGYFVGRVPKERHYRLVRSALPVSEEKENSLHAGLPLQTVSQGLGIEGLLNRADLDDSELSTLLADILKKVDRNRPANREKKWLELKSELTKALLLALHIQLDVSVDDPVVTPGQDSITIDAILSNHSGMPVTLVSMGVIDAGGQTLSNMGPESPITLADTNRSRAVLRVPEHMLLTLPAEDHVFDSRTRVQTLTVQTKLRYRGVVMELLRPVDVEIAPPVHLEAVSKDILVRLGHTKSVQIPLQITCWAKGGSGFIGLSLPWNREISTIPFSFDDFKLNNENETLQAVFEVEIPADLEAGEYPVVLSAETDGQIVSTDTVLLKVGRVEIEHGLKVGIVRSYDETMERAVAELGLTPVLIDAAMLSTGDLSQFDTIVIDIRAYLVRNDLVENNVRLLEYVHAGGNLVVMYQKTFEWNESFGHPPYSPYPLQLSRNRITVESAPVRLLAPMHSLLSWPNRLVDADWDYWIQERGLYFPLEYDTQAYVELIESGDPGETPLRSGYLVADYGSGSYVYTAYVWYRQLGQSNIGAYRAFANMLSYPKRAR